MDTLREATPVPPATSLTVTLLSPVFVELLKEVVGPFNTTGETDAVTFTLPTKLFMLLRVIVDVPKEP